MNKWAQKYTFFLELYPNSQKIHHAIIGKITNFAYSKTDAYKK